MPSLSDSTKTAIATTLATAGHGERTAIADRLAATYGVSRATIYRVAKRGGTSRKRAPKRPEYRGWTRIAVAMSHLAPKPIPLDLAIRGAIASGDLPPEAVMMPVSTARTIARAQLLTPKPKRTHRMHADYPMQALQIDGSSSEHLVVAKALPDGDYLLKLHRRPYSAKGYKNKPVGPDRLRVLLYAVWDMCTGYTYSQYCAAKGETALDAMDFLCCALTLKANPRIPIHGVPDDVWSDLGPFAKSTPATDLLERLDINLVTGEPYKKERMGGVERSHRTRWSRLERSLFMRGKDTITLSDLNARLTEFEIEHNASRPSRTPVAGKTVSRTAAWIALTNARPADNPLRKLPDNPIETMAQEARRKIDSNGIVRWDGIEYECERLHSCWVIARRGMDATGNLIVEDERGEKHIAQPYKARLYGEIRGVKTSALEALIKDTALSPSADIYAPAGQQTGQNVRPMPTRSSAPASLDNPLDAEHYRTIEEAMLAFIGSCPHELSDANRDTIEQLIIDADLSKSKVIELVQEMSGIKSSNQL